MEKNTFENPWHDPKHPKACGPKMITGYPIKRSYWHFKFYRHSLTNTTLTVENGKIIAETLTVDGAIRALENPNSPIHLARK